MRFISLAPQFSEGWDKVVYNSDDAWLYHLYNGLQVNGEVWNLESKSFLLEHEGKIIGIFPLQLNKNESILKSINLGNGGPALIKGLDLVLRAKALKAMFEHAEEIALKCNVSEVEVRLPPLSESALNSRWGVNPLVNYFYSDISTHTWIIDLKKSKEEIYDNLSTNAKREIKEAVNKGYKIREINSRDEMDIYYAIHCQTYKRTGAIPHPKEYFLGIYDYFVLANLAKIWIAVDKNNTPVALFNAATFKKKAVYWTGCCKNEDLKRGVYYLLFWQAIGYAKDNGFEWFECGEAFPNLKEGKLKGLTLFKSKFGGELHRYFKGRLVLTYESEKKKLLKDWVNCTSLLLKPVFGERFINFVNKSLRLFYHFLLKIYRLLKTDV
jgi:hypothetical protein